VTAEERIAGSVGKWSHRLHIDSRMRGLALRDTPPVESHSVHFGTIRKDEMQSRDGTAAPQRRAKRRWTLPVALLRGPGETLEGIRILQEVQGDAGTALWQTVRDVTLWAETAPDGRAYLFHLGAVARRQVLLASAGLDDELRAAAEVVLSEILGPWAGEPERVVVACQAVAQRAERLRLPGTAIAFAQAAALADADRASLAHEVGRHALDGGEPARADSWFRRAVAQKHHTLLRSDVSHVGGGVRKHSSMLYMSWSSLTR